MNVLLVVVSVVGDCVDAVEVVILSVVVVVVESGTAYKKIVYIHKSE